MRDCWVPKIQELSHDRTLGLPFLLLSLFADNHSLFVNPGICV